MFTCPFNEICCPYYDKNTSSCSLSNPEENCDDYIFYSWDEEEGLEWEEDNEEDE